MISDRNRTEFGGAASIVVSDTRGRMCRVQHHQSPLIHVSIRPRKPFVSFNLFNFSPQYVPQILLQTNLHASFFYNFFIFCLFKCENNLRFIVICKGVLIQHGNVPKITEKTLIYIYMFNYCLLYTSRCV